MVSEFVTWINEIVEQRGWSYRELARRAGLSDSAISLVARGERNPGSELVIKVAEAVHADPVRLLRLAEILPPLPPTAGEEEQAMYLFRQIPTPEQRDAALRMLSGLSDHSHMTPQPEPDRATRMGIEPTLQEFIRRAFRLMWEIAPPGERAAMFVEFVGELSREAEYSSTEPAKETGLDAHRAQ